MSDVNNEECSDVLSCVFNNIVASFITEQAGMIIMLLHITMIISMLSYCPATPVTMEIVSSSHYNKDHLRQQLLR